MSFEPIVSTLGGPSKVNDQSEREVLTQQYQALVAKRDQLNAKRIELQTTFNYHKSEYTRLLDELKSTYKVSSLKEAYKLQEELEAKAKKELAELSNLLSQFDSILNPSGDSDE